MREDVLTLSRRWARAERDGDAEFLALLLDDDFVAIGPRGLVLDKSLWLDRLQSGRLHYDELDWDELELHEHGDCALVVGREAAAATEDGHATRTPPYRVTQVFVADSGDWRLAALQFSPIATA